MAHRPALIRAEPVRPLSEAQLFAILDAAVEAAEPAIAATVLAAIHAVQAVGGNPERLAAQLAGLDLALRIASPDAAVAAIHWGELRTALSVIFEASVELPAGLLSGPVVAGGDLGIRLLPVGADLSRFDAARARDRAVAWIRRRGAALVTEITEQTRLGFRKVLEEAFRAPVSIDALGRDIREVLTARQANGLIGVTTKQGDRLGRYIAELVADPDLSPGRIQQLIDRKYAAMMRDRSNLIAVTEAYEAGNQGLIEAWEEANASGAARIESGRFVDEVGAGKRKGIVFARPPLHPRCYCCLRLVSQPNGAYRMEWVTRKVGVCRRCQAMDGKLAA